ncbi:MAG: DUF3048 domain-containing protein [Oscillospiraceae bacterium]|nr:DUF3048 domain-containing protein [Oscillospiraceae bacterium]
MKRIIVFILALSLLLTMAACSEAPASSAAPPEETPEASSPSPEVPAAPKPSQEPVPEVYEEPEELKYNDFFTGLPLAEQDYSRPFAIMINNLKPALPHHGVSQADLIFELPVEGGITRMLGIFTDMDNIDKIGSVRSLRPYYADIAAAYDAVLVHAGYSIDAIIRKNVLGLDNMDGITDGGGAEAFARDEERYAAGIGVEHTLFGTGPSIKAYAEKVGYELSVSEEYDSGLRFAESAAPSGGQNAGKLTVNFGYKTTEFSYDAEKGVYTAFQLDSDYIDGNTGEKVEFANILALDTSVYIYDEENHLSIDLVGEGEGIFASGGKAVPIKWERADEHAPFRFYLADGSELLLGRGISYVAVYSDRSGDVTFE